MSVPSAPCCFLQLRHAKQTVFVEVKENTTVGELRQLLAEILTISPETIRLKSEEKFFDADTKHLSDYGINTTAALPHAPFQVEFLVEHDDDNQVIPYSGETTFFNDDHSMLEESL